MKRAKSASMPYNDFLFCHLNSLESASCQFQKSRAVHQLIRQIRSVTKQRICRYRRWSVPCLLPARNVDRPKRDTVLFGSLLYDRDIFCVERTLAGVV